MFANHHPDQSLLSKGRIQEWVVAPDQRPPEAVVHTDDLGMEWGATKVDKPVPPPPPPSPAPAHDYWAEVEPYEPNEDEIAEREAAMLEFDRMAEEQAIRQQLKPCTKYKKTAEPCWLRDMKVVDMCSNCQYRDWLAGQAEAEDPRGSPSAYL